MRVVLSSRRHCTYTQLPQASVRSRPDTAGIAVVPVLNTLEDATAGARHGPAPTPLGGDALPSIRARRLAERPEPGHPILHALIAPSSRGRDPLSESGAPGGALPGPRSFHGPTRPAFASSPITCLPLPAVRCRAPSVSRPCPVSNSSRVHDVALVRPPPRPPPPRAPPPGPSAAPRPAARRSPRSARARSGACAPARRCQSAAAADSPRRRCAGTTD
jgi:hypothetical protein